MKILLNLAVPHNYMFMCPEAKVHLDVTSPIGVIQVITPSVKRGLECGKLILVEEAPIVPPIIKEEPTISVPLPKVEEEKAPVKSKKKNK